MSDEGRRQFRRDFPAVQKILWEDWDPIGCGVPQDEYDSYVPGVIQELRNGADAEELADHLRRVAKEMMSCTVPEDRLKLVVAKLLKLDLA